MSSTDCAQRGLRPTRPARAAALVLLVLMLASGPAASLGIAPAEPGAALVELASTACGHPHEMGAGPDSAGAGPLDPDQVTLQPSSCQGTLRPGIRVATPFNTCTAGFVFNDTAGNLYLSTAGHCFGDAVDCQYGPAHRVTTEDVGEFGSKVACLRNGLGWDVALIRIDDNKTYLVDSAMCAWAGPSLSTDARPGEGFHYGHGQGYRHLEETRARSGRIMAVDEGDFRMIGLATNGDSGSPVRHANGAAIGILTHASLNAYGAAAHSGPYAYGTTVPRIIAVSAALGYDVTLVPDPAYGAMDDAT